MRDCSKAASFITKKINIMTLKLYKYIPVIFLVLFCNSISYSQIKYPRRFLDSKTVSWTPVSIDFGILAPSAINTWVNSTPVTVNLNMKSEGSSTSTVSISCNNQAGISVRAINFTAINASNGFYQVTFPYVLPTSPMLFVSCNQNTNFTVSGSFQVLCTLQAVPGSYNYNITVTIN
jgi:hypothetical protein